MLKSRRIIFPSRAADARSFGRHAYVRLSWEKRGGFWSAMDAIGMAEHMIYDVPGQNNAIAGLSMKMPNDEIVENSQQSHDSRLFFSTESLRVTYGRP